MDQSHQRIQSNKQASIKEFLAKTYVDYKSAIQQTKYEFQKILRREVYHQNQLPHFTIHESTKHYLNDAKINGPIQIPVEINIHRDELPLKTIYYETIPKNVRVQDPLPLIPSRLTTSSLEEVINGNYDFENTISSIKKKIRQIQEENEQFFMNKDYLFVRVIMTLFIKQNPNLSSISLIQEIAQILNKQPIQLQKLFLQEYSKKKSFKNKYIPQKQQFYVSQRFFCQMCCTYICSHHFWNYNYRIFNEKYRDQVEEKDEFQFDIYIDTPYNYKSKPSTEAIEERTRDYKSKNHLEKNFMCFNYLNCSKQTQQCVLDVEMILKKFQKNFIENLWNFGIENPCFVAHCLKNNDYSITCQQVYQHQIWYRSHKRLQSEEISLALNQERRRISTSRYTREMENFYEDAYQPCFHEKECDQICECKMCQKWCGCSSSCKKKFNGCKCQDKCISERCECQQKKFDCDPDICKCGISSDYSNREVSHYRRQDLFKCLNSSLVFQFKPRIVLGKSLICQGLGVFAGQNFQKLEYIGEYRGSFLEINQESELIEYIDQIVGTHFLFFLNDNVQIDGTYFATKTKFINHAKKNSPLVNCDCTIHHSQGTQKVIIFAKRNIKLGEELFFDYGDQFKTVWKENFDRASDLYFGKTTKEKQKVMKMKPFRL